MITYPLINTLPEEYIRERLEFYLNEDIPEDDYTSLATIDENSVSTGIVESLDDFIFVGEFIIKELFKDNFEVKIFAKDGDRVAKNFIIAEIKGNTRELLKKERTMLNIMQRLSGIATSTARYTDITEPHNIKILDTRKTTPGMRLFEKYAVAMGGGHNHRLNLSSAILIKDNHIKAAGSITNAINNAKAMNLGLNIEVEADTLEQVEEICLCGADGILLDNMNNEQTVKAVEIVKKHNLRNKIYIISSGGINFENIYNYLNTGIDGISLGAVTHSVKAVDIHLEIK